MRCPAGNTQVLTPIMSRIHHMIDAVVHDDERTLALHIQMLANKPQSFFELRYISPTNYREAVRELQLIQSTSLPCDKLAVLLNVVDIIYQTVRHLCPICRDPALPEGHVLHCAKAADIADEVSTCIHVCMRCAAVCLYTGRVYR